MKTLFDACEKQDGFKGFATTSAYVVHMDASRIYSRHICICFFHSKAQLLEYHAYPLVSCSRLSWNPTSARFFHQVSFVQYDVWHQSRYFGLRENQVSRADFGMKFKGVYSKWPPITKSPCMTKDVVKRFERKITATVLPRTTVIRPPGFTRKYTVWDNPNKFWIDRY